MAVSLKEGRAVRGVEAIAERPDGTRVWFAPFPTPLFDSGGRLIGGINMLVDITDRKRAEQAVRERQTWLDGQREALEAAVNGADLEDSLGILVRTAIQGVGGDARAGFYLANEEGTALRHVVGMPADYAKAVDGFKVGPDSLACGLATATGKPVLTADVRIDPLWQPWLWMAEKFDYRACWSFPIHTAARRFVGTLAIYSRQPREATPRDQELGALLAHTASIIISRHKESEVRQQTEQALLHSERHLELVSNSVPALISYVGKDGRYRSCNNAYTTWFGLPREQIIGRPMPEVLGEKAWEVVGPRIEAALRGETVEYEAETHYHSGTRWIHAVYTPHHAVDGTVEGIVVMVTDVTRRKRVDDRLRLLWEAAGILLSTDDPNAMLMELFHKIRPHVGLDMYLNFMVEENQDTLRLASCEGVSEETSGAIARIQFGQAICGAVALQQKPIHATFVQQSDEPMVRLVKSLGVRAYACNPLLFEGRLLGTLSFASRTRDEFDPDDLRFSKRFANT
jgi:PAS domain S-box-containing protein